MELFTRYIWKDSMLVNGRYFIDIKVKKPQDYWDLRNKLDSPEAQFITVGLISDLEKILKRLHRPGSQQTVHVKHLGDLYELQEQKRWFGLRKETTPKKKGKGFVFYRDASQNIQSTI